MMHTFVLLAYLTFLTQTASSVYTTISSAADFVGFANEVNSGTTYRGSTVTLTNDIDFKGVSFPGVGMYVDSTSQRYFRGTFNGNGHTISNLRLYSTSTTYLGLFAVVNGGVIKGIVVDSSCSIENKEPKYFTYAGGIVANSIAGIEFKLLDCVNMAKVTGSGEKASIGGIIGCLYAFASTTTIHNCVNFGTVTNTGTGEKASTGGIVGWMSQEETNSPASGVYNCVNLGTVTAATEKVGAIAGNIESTSYTIKNAFWLSGSCVRPFPSTAKAEMSKELGADFSVNGGPLADVMNSYVNTVSNLGLRKWGKVTLHPNGGSSTGTRATFFVLVGEPGTPVKTGHTFKGWYTDAGFSAGLNTKTRYGSGVGAELYAKWETNKYTVSFVTGMGRVSVPPATSLFGSTIQLENVTRDGYTFGGWKDEKGNVFFDNYAIVNDKDIVLTAVWDVNSYTLSFDFGNGTVVESPVNYDETIEYPEYPTVVVERVGYSFNGWDSDIPIMPSRDVAIKALWSLNNYTLSFDFDNGTVVEELVDYGSLIEYPTNIEKTGYEFVGWDSSIERMPAENVVIKATWDINNYTVTFDLGNGDVVEKVIEYNELIEYPTNVEKTGYEFVGWDSSIERMPAENVVITATWDINNYTVTFDLGDGDVVEKVVEYNGLIEYPTNPEKVGYTFNGWDSVIERMPAEDVTIKALWIDISTEYVEILFGKKEMTESEVHNIINKHTQGDNYEIKFFGSDDGNTRVIVKFVDPVDASKFIRSLELSSQDDSIQEIRFADEFEYTLSFSAGLLPLGVFLLCTSIWG